MDKKSSKKSKPKQQEETKDEFQSVFEKNGQIFIVVSAKPGSKTDAITAVEPGFIGVSVKAPPKDGQANDGIKEYMAQVLSMKKRDISLVKGDKSSEKVLLIEEPNGLTPAAIIEILKESMNDS